MKPQREFVAERAAARHCDALLRQAPKADPLPALARFGTRLAAALPAALAPWHNGIPPLAQCGAVRECDPVELAANIPALAANCLLATGGADQPLLLSIGAPAVFGLIDRAFGGRGAVPDPLPSTFPASGDALIERIQRLIAARIAAVLEVPVHPLRRDSDLARLAPFVRAERIATLEIAISGDRAHEAWSFTLAAPLTDICELFGDGERARAQPRPRSAANPAAAPFGDIPIPVCAVLVETLLPLTALAALEVGSLLPVAVARQVPLRIAGRTIARGAVGAIDDCAALQISTLY